MKPAAFLMISISSVLSACVNMPPNTPAAACGPDMTPVQVQAAVDQYLANSNWKDPESVKIRNVRAEPCKSIWMGLLNGGKVLGWEIFLEVNAKNSYGGYTGFQTKSIVKTVDGRTIVTEDP